eukprot:CAMPEP_0196726860 /NCGR_PEP_ID=MMETSP1091-20130531/7993_1 /TAXON_ID=302021 /ORGANISM="Rhodomonas sp., Strain CCMP768" /LENGTH=150 /DNA_ID=CAMNT_0042069351 /DNA_START=8 /DNA_END=460 /DNA_ORIENTATION=+
MADQEDDLQQKVDILEQVAKTLKKKLRKMEADLEVEEKKKHEVLDKLLTLEGYWSCPPSSHEASPYNSADEREPEPMAQPVLLEKRKAPEPLPLLGQGSPHQRLLMMQQPRAHKPGAGGAGKPKVDEEQLLSAGIGADIIASLTNAAMRR